MNNQVNTTESEIARFFAGRKVLLTGGLGFLGKLLIEKLLRCCPNIATLYVLVRGKDGKNPEERVRQLLEMPLYERLKKEQPDFLGKLTVIEGDLEMANLGLSPENRRKLLDANVIFHGTAIVRSNQRLGTMANVNVRATKDVLLLARQMLDLRAFVYLSSLFAHSPIKSIEEKHYPPPMETDELLSLINILKNDKLEGVASKLMGDWPNAFAFTKAIAEETVLRYAHGISACIVRPSIVSWTWKEPLAGWADSVYGPVGLLAGARLGLLRSIHCRTDKRLDFVPADYVTSSLIAAAWDMGRTKVARADDDDATIVPDVQRVPVYNHVCSPRNPITWNTFRGYLRTHGCEMRGVFWNGALWLHRILMCLFYLLPAVMVDAVALVTGRDPSWYKVYKKLDAHLLATSYFTTQQWYVKNDALVKLWQRLNSVDGEIFPFDMDRLDWSEYAKCMLRRIERFTRKSARTAIEEGLSEYVDME